MYEKDFHEPSFLIKTELEENNENLISWGISLQNSSNSLVIGSTGTYETNEYIFTSALTNSLIIPNKKPCMVFSGISNDRQQKFLEMLQKNNYEVEILDLKNNQTFRKWSILGTINHYYKMIEEYKNKIDYLEIHSKIVFDDLVKETKCFKHKLKMCKNCMNEALKENKKKISKKNDEENNEKFKFKELYLTLIETNWLPNMENAEKIINKQILNYRKTAYKEVIELAKILLNYNSKNKKIFECAQILLQFIIMTLLNDLEEFNKNNKIKKITIKNILDILNQEENIFLWLSLKSKTIINEENSFIIKKISKFNEQKIIKATDVLNELLNDIKKFDSDFLEDLEEFSLFNFFTNEKPKAIIICDNDNDYLLNKLKSVFISQLKNAIQFETNEFQKLKIENYIQRDTIFYIDDFSKISKIPDFEIFLENAKNHKIHFNLCFNSFEQIEKIYNIKNASIIKKNCLLTIYLSSESKKTHHEISNMCGQKILKTKYSQINLNLNDNKKYTLKGEPLIRPKFIETNFFVFDEKKQWVNDKFAIVINKNSHPSIVNIKSMYRKDIFY